MAVSPTEIHVEVIPPKSYYLDATCSPLQGCLSLHTRAQPNATPLTYLKYTGYYRIFWNLIRTIFTVSED